MPRTKSNPSIPTEHIPTDKHYTEDGRKLKDLPQVGVESPDTDADEPLARPPLRDPGVDDLDVDQGKRR